MATIEKAEIKIHTANEIGVDLEDMMEQAVKAEHMHEGAKIALADAYKKVNALADHLHKAVEDGDVKLEDLDTVEKIEGFTRHYIAHCANVVDSLRLMAQNAQLGSAGMVAAYKNAMKVPMKIMDAERKKLEAVQSVLEAAQAAGEGDVELRPGAPAPRPVGIHPGNPLGARRAAEKSAKEEGDQASQEAVSSSSQTKLTGKPAELLKQVEAGLSALDAANPDVKTPEMQTLQRCKEFLQSGGDLRTKEGRELKEQTLAILPGTKKTARK